MRINVIIFASAILLLAGAIALNVVDMTGNPVATVKPTSSSAPKLLPATYAEGVKYFEVEYDSITADLRDAYNGDPKTCLFEAASSAPVVRIKSDQNLLKILNKIKWKFQFISADEITSEIYLAYVNQTEGSFVYVLFANSANNVELAGAFEQSQLSREIIFGNAVSASKTGITLGLLLKPISPGYQLLTTFNDDNRIDSSDNDDFMMDWRSNDNSYMSINTAGSKCGVKTYNFYRINELGANANTEEPNDVRYGAVTASKGWTGIGTRNTDGQNKLGMIILWPEFHCEDDEAVFNIPA